MKVEYVIEKRSESETEVEIVLQEVGRQPTQEEIDTPAPPNLRPLSKEDRFRVSSKLALTYWRGNGELETVRALPIGHRCVLEF